MSRLEAAQKSSQRQNPQCSGSIFLFIRPRGDCRAATHSSCTIPICSGLFEIPVRIDSRRELKLMSINFNSNIFTTGKDCQVTFRGHPQLPIVHDLIQLFRFLHPGNPILTHSQNLCRLGFITWRGLLVPTARGSRR